jgi:hypothetical protein
MFENEFIGLISQVGFPIAVSVYLLFSRDKTIKSMTEELKNLTIAVCNQTEIIKARL